MTEETTSHPILPWGGLLETLENCQENTDLPKNLKILKEKITFLEEAKTIREIQDGIAFTKEERNYLNSPLLDEIYETIFSVNPFSRAILKGKLAAARFYAKRTRKKNLNNLKEKLLWTWSTYGSEEKKIDCLEFLRENKVDIVEYNFLPKIDAEDHEPKLVKFLLDAGIIKNMDAQEFSIFCHVGLFQIVRFLIEKIPSEEMHNYTDSNALYHAVLSASEDLRMYFLKYENINFGLDYEDTGKNRLIYLVKRFYKNKFS